MAWSEVAGICGFCRDYEGAPKCTPSVIVYRKRVSEYFEKASEYRGLDLGINNVILYVFFSCLLLEIFILSFHLSILLHVSSYKVI